MPLWLPWASKLKPRRYTMIAVAALGFAGSHQVRADPAPTSSPCPEIVAQMTPGLHARTAGQDQPRVEVRRCQALGNAMQIVAWTQATRSAALVLDVARFSLSSVLMDGNVFVMVFPGPYDSIVVVQYLHGEPKVAFTDSTHAEILLGTTTSGVTVTLDHGTGKKDVKLFEVDEGELTLHHR